jgi:TolA-binding protein
MHKNRKAMSRPIRTHGAARVRMLHAGIWLCALCGAAPVSAAGSGPAPAPVPAAHGAVLQPARTQTRPAFSEPPQDRQLTRELWSSRITAPNPNEDAAGRLALKRLIEQVRSVRFGNEAAQATPASPVAVRSTAEPLPTEPAATPPAKLSEAASIAPPSVTAASSPSPGQHKAFAGLPQDSGRMSDPLEVAELLFLSGRPADAAPFYAQALEHLRPGDAVTAADRAWTLFQLATCLRETNMDEARATYAKLISEYPDSPWTELARAQSQLLSWYQKDRPQQLVASRQP